MSRKIDFEDLKKYLEEKIEQYRAAEFSAMELGLKASYEHDVSEQFKIAQAAIDHILSDIEYHPRFQEKKDE